KNKEFASFTRFIIFHLLVDYNRFVSYRLCLNSTDPKYSYSMSAPLFSFEHDRRKSMIKRLNQQIIVRIINFQRHLFSADRKRAISPSLISAAGSIKIKSPSSMTGLIVRLAV